MSIEEFKIPSKIPGQLEFEGLENEKPEKKPTTEIKRLNGQGEIAKIANSFLDRLEEKDFNTNNQEEIGQELEPDQLINAIILIKRNNLNNPTLIPSVLENLSEPEISSIADFVSKQEKELVKSYLETFKCSPEITSAIRAKLEQGNTAIAA
jgi:hypothetical protein